MNDRHFMQMALDLAVLGKGRTSPNPMVGAVLVNGGHVVGSGYHARAGGPHAEIVALKKAGGKARGAILYVTLEPCCHYGRTGPCTEAIIEAGVKKVVVAASDPNPVVSGKGLDRLRDAGLEVVSGVMAGESKKLNEVFNKYISTGLPFVVCKAAMSLDGKIATRTGESRWITGSESRERVHRLRDTYDAILVGVGTVLSDDPSLTTRLPGESGRDPLRIVLDSHARTPPDCKLLTQESAAESVIVTGEKVSKKRRRELERSGARVISMECNGYGIDLVRLLRRLGKEGISSLLVEGGATVHASFFAQKTVDKVVWFIAPRIIGGQDAPGPVGGPGIAKLKESVHLKEMNVQTCGDDLLIEGYPEK